MAGTNNQGTSSQLIPGNEWLSHFERTNTNPMEPYIQGTRGNREDAYNISFSINPTQKMAEISIVKTG